VLTFSKGSKRKEKCYHIATHAIIAVLNSIYRFENVKIDESRFETLYPIPYTLDPTPKKGSKFEPFSPQCLYKMSRKNITRSCDVCAFPYRGTNGHIRFESRIAEPSEWAHPACTGCRTMRARTSGV
jgi:hypothetical protein